MPYVLMIQRYEKLYVADTEKINANYTSDLNLAKKYATLEDAEDSIFCDEVVEETV